LGYSTENLLLETGTATTEPVLPGAVMEFPRAWVTAEPTVTVTFWLFHPIFLGGNQDAFRFIRK
jgi:hypothetical protein